MQTLQQHLRRVLRPRLLAFSALQLQVWLQLRELHDDVARCVALWCFALPVVHPELDRWIAQIHRIWADHFIVRECYDGVLFLPQRASLLKRPVLALFQHRHVTNKAALAHIDAYPVGETCELFIHCLFIRFYGNRRDVERMKQRSWNALIADTSLDFVPDCRYGSMLQLKTRPPDGTVGITRIPPAQCLDCALCTHKWIDWPNYDHMFDDQDRRLGFV